MRKLFLFIGTYSLPKTDRILSILESFVTIVTREFLLNATSGFDKSFDSTFNLSSELSEVI